MKYRYQGSPEIVWLRGFVFFRIQYYNIEYFNMYDSMHYARYFERQTIKNYKVGARDSSHRERSRSAGQINIACSQEQYSVPVYWYDTLLCLRYGTDTVILGYGHTSL